MISERIIAVRLKVRSAVAHGGELLAAVTMNPVLIWGVLVAAPLALFDRILARLHPGTCDLIACITTLAAVITIQVAAPSYTPAQSLQRASADVIVLAGQLR